MQMSQIGDWGIIFRETISSGLVKADLYTETKIWIWSEEIDRSRGWLDRVVGMLWWMWEACVSVFV